MTTMTKMMIGFSLTDGAKITLHFVLKDESYELSELYKIEQRDYSKRGRGCGYMRARIEVASTIQATQEILTLTREL